MESRFAIFVLGYAALTVLAVSSAVIYWRNGQTRQAWKQWLEQLIAGSFWHFVATLSGVVVLVVLATMRFS